MGLTDQGVLEKGTAIAVKMLRISEAQLGGDEVLTEAFVSNSSVSYSEANMSLEASPEVVPGLCKLHTTPSAWHHLLYFLLTQVGM